MKFELASFFTLQGVKIHLLCLDALPMKLIQLRQSCFDAMAFAS